MSLPTSTKHRLLLEYNRKRKQKFDHYMEKKPQDTGAQTQPNKDGLDSIDVECKALYKKLAEDHMNKDVYVPLPNTIIITSLD